MEFIIAILVAITFISLIVVLTQSLSPRYLEGKPSIDELLKKAGIVCPKCGQHPNSYARRDYYSQNILLLTCPYLHSWSVNDTEWLPGA